MPILPSVTLEGISQYPVCKLSRLSGKVPESFWIAESFWTGWKVSRQYLHFGTYVAKPIYALLPESFCAWKSVAPKVLIFLCLCSSLWSEIKLGNFAWNIWDWDYMKCIFWGWFWLQYVEILFAVWFCWPSLHEIYGDIFAGKLSKNFPRNWIPEGWSLQGWMADDVSNLLFCRNDLRAIICSNV